MRDQFLEGPFDSRFLQKLYEVETNCNFCEVLLRAQELERIQEKRKSFGTRTAKWKRGLQPCRRQ